MLAASTAPPNADAFGPISRTTPIVGNLFANVCWLSSHLQQPYQLFRTQHKSPMRHQCGSESFRFPTLAPFHSQQHSTRPTPPSAFSHLTHQPYHTFVLQTLLPHITKQSLSKLRHSPLSKPPRRHKALCLLLLDPIKPPLPLLLSLSSQTFPPTFPPFSPHHHNHPNAPKRTPSPSQNS